MKTANLAVKISETGTATLKDIAEVTGACYVTLFLRYKKLKVKLKRAPDYRELTAWQKLGRPFGS